MTLHETLKVCVAYSCMSHTYACLISNMSITQHAEGLWHVAMYLDHVYLTPRCSNETRTHPYYIVICGDMCAIFKTCFLALILCGKLRASTLRFVV